jgi:hypothetical protein
VRSEKAFWGEKGRKGMNNYSLFGIILETNKGKGNMGKGNGGRRLCSKRTKPGPGETPPE